MVTVWWTLLFADHASSLSFAWSLYGGYCCLLIMPHLSPCMVTVWWTLLFADHASSLSFAWSLYGGHCCLLFMIPISGLHALCMVDTAVCCLDSSLSFASHCMVDTAVCRFDSSLSFAWSLYGGHCCLLL